MPVNKPIAIFFFVLLALSAPGQETLPEDLEGWALERPDAQTVHRQMQDLLSDETYQPRRSLLQSLKDFLFGWDPEMPEISSALGRLLLWGLLIWCIITLLAILAHFIWTILVMAPGGKAFKAAADPAVPELTDKSAEQLYALAQRMAQEGNYTQALTCLLLAVLKTLDARGILRFHASKTNGDYVRDFPREYQQYTEFKMMVDLFERSVYGRVLSAQAAFERMTLLARNLQTIEQTETEK